MSDADRHRRASPRRLRHASAASRSSGSPSGSAARRSSPTTARCSPSGSRCCAPTLPADIELSYAVKANPMPAVVQHLSGLVDSLDVASAGEMRVALDTPMPADRVSFAGPGKTPAELTQAIAAGVTIEMESETEAERVIADRRAARHPPARRGPRQPGLRRSRARGCGWAAARSSSASTPSRCPRCSRELAGADLDVPRLPHLRRLAEPQRRDPVRGAAQDRRAGAAPRRRGARAGPLPQPRRRLRHPLLREGRAARPRARSARTSTACWPTRSARACPRRAS